MSRKEALLSCIGGTPLVCLHFPAAERGAQVWCKLEFMNPGGSSKDRMCLAIVEDMEAKKIIRPGDCLVEASGGNTAISLAMIAAAKGYSLILVMPEAVPVERRNFLSAYGAQIVLTSPSNGMKGSVTRATDMLGSRRRSFMINQFENPANPEAHRRTTAVEILSDLGKAPDIFVAGVGTGGTFTGVGKVLRKENPAIKLIAVEPAESAILSGGNPGPHRIPGIGAGFIPGNLNTDIIDDVAAVSYEEAAETVKLMAEQTGIYVGLSSGAAVCEALRRAERMGPEKVVVTICCDAGERYTCFE
jgi:cysteine synthase A